MLTLEPPAGSRLSRSAIRTVGLVLSTHMDASGGSCYPSLDTLADETGMERSTVSRCCRALTIIGAVETAKRGRGNRYQALLLPTDYEVFLRELETRLASLDDECWLWTRRLDGSGYGIVTVPTAPQHARQQAVHRVVIEFVTGKPIRTGYHVHHECRQKACWNPRHLTVLSAAEHARLHFAENLGVDKWKNLVDPGPSPVEKPVDFHVETVATKALGSASYTATVGEIPNEDAREDAQSEEDLRDQLLLAGGNLLEPVQDVAALVAESLGAVT